MMLKVGENAATDDRDIPKKEKLRKGYIELEAIPGLQQIFRIHDMYGRVLHDRGRLEALQYE